MINHIEETADGVKVTADTRGEHSWPACKPNNSHIADYFLLTTGGRLGSSCAQTLQFCVAPGPTMYPHRN